MAEADTRNLSDAHTQMPSLKGRKAVITGGTTGIGRAIGVLLASEGVEIFTCGRNAQHLDDGLARINEVGKGSGISVDLAEKAGLDRFFAEAETALGRYDIAVVNAAIPADGLTEVDEAEARYAIAIDFTAYLLSAHKAAAHMRDRGDIILIGSNWGGSHHPAWSYNLLANPRASVRLKGKTYGVTARLVTGPEREEKWRMALQIWPAYATYKERAAHREIRVFHLTKDKSKKSSGTM